MTRGEAPPGSPALAFEQVVVEVTEALPASVRALL